MELFLDNCHASILLALHFYFCAHDCEAAKDENVAPLEAATCMLASADGHGRELGPTIFLAVVALAGRGELFLLQVAPRRENELLGQIAERVVDASIIHGFLDEDARIVVEEAIV